MFLGAQFGTVISMPLSGLLSVSQWGWPSVFYVFGAIGTLWCIFFLSFVYEDPFSSPRIDDDERKYIQKTLGVINGSAVRIVYYIAGILYKQCAMHFITRCPIFLITLNIFLITIRFGTTVDLFNSEIKFYRLPYSMF